MRNLTDNQEKAMKIFERELWIEQNCECGISEKTGKWSEKVFESFGCNCETESDNEQ